MEMWARNELIFVDDQALCARGAGVSMGSFPGAEISHENRDIDARLRASEVIGISRFVEEIHEPDRATSGVLSLG